MSTKNKNQNGLPQDKMRIALIGSFIVVIIIISVSIISFYIGKKEGTEQQSPIPTIDLSKVSANNNYQRILGAKTYDWSGKVSNVSGSKIVFSTQVKNEQGTIKTREITAVVNANTELVKWDLTKPPSPDQPNSNKEYISLAQIKPGQQIVVRANNDLNGQNEVKADSVSILITPSIK